MDNIYIYIFNHHKIPINISFFWAPVVTSQESAPVEVPTEAEALTGSGALDPYGENVTTGRIITIVVNI